MKKEINYTGTHKHSHNKGGLVGALKGLQGAKHYGAQHGARHKDAKTRALKKLRGEKVEAF